MIIQSFLNTIANCLRSKQGHLESRHQDCFDILWHAGTFSCRIKTERRAQSWSQVPGAKTNVIWSHDCFFYVEFYSKCVSYLQGLSDIYNT